MEKITKIDEILLYEQSSAKEDIKEVKEQFSKEQFCNFLEWNRIELAADAELRLELVTHFIEYVNSHTAIAVRNNIVHIAESAISRLTGEGYMVGTGPWDQRSTSQGSNRLAVIKANFLRWQISLANKLIKYFDEWQDKLSL